ncbi:hypothetical protein OESDEN_25407, partial [Oesophagostomum dentatum]
LQIFTADLPIIVREYQSNVYSPAAYFVAINAADAVQYLVFPTLYSMIVYALAEYSWTFQQYLKFNLLNIIVAFLASSIGYAAACIFGTLSLATTYVPVIIGP